MLPQGDGYQSNGLYSDYCILAPPPCPEYISIPHTDKSTNTYQRRNSQLPPAKWIPKAYIKNPLAEVIW